MATDGVKGNVEKTAALGFVDGQDMMIQPIEINRVTSYLEMLTQLEHCQWAGAPSRTQHVRFFSWGEASAEELDDP